MTDPTHALGSIEPVAERDKMAFTIQNLFARHLKVDADGDIVGQGKCSFAIADTILSPDYLERVRAMEAENARLREALEALTHAVCGETGFAAAVRMTSGTAYPWPALDEAEELARAALSNREDGDV
jgi:hypothetical protein